VALWEVAPRAVVLAQSSRTLETDADWLRVPAPWPYGPDPEELQRPAEQHSPPENLGLVGHFWSLGHLCRYLWRSTAYMLHTTMSALLRL
jgi:hypothetical protein